MTLSDGVSGWTFWQRTKEHTSDARKRGSDENELSEEHGELVCVRMKILLKLMMKIDEDSSQGGYLYF